MKLSSFKEAFDPLFLADLDQRIKQSASYSPDPFTTSLLDHLKVLALGGKRFRPYAVVLAYQTETSDDSFPEKLLPLLCGLEYLHIFALIHDDIMDKSKIRHGVDTIEEHTRKELEKNNRTGDLPHIATSHAILIGDLVFSWSQKLLSSFAMEEKHSVEILDYIHTMIDELVLGQMLDIDMTTRKHIEPALIETKVKIKSGNYTFVHPMSLGAMVAGSSTEFYRKVGTELGMAFQLVDDVLDIAPTEETGKSSFVDVASRTYTVLTQYAHESMNEEQRNFLDEKFGTTLTTEDQTKLRDIYRSTGCIDKTKEKIKQHLDTATDIIASYPNASTKAEWRELITLIANRKN